MLGLVRKTLDAGGSYRVPSGRLLDGVLPDVGDTRAKASAFWVLIACSSVIAAAGIVLDSTATVIGAMVIAPLGTPIYGVAAALATGYRSGPALLQVLGGVAVAIGIGVLVDLATLDRMAVDLNPQVQGRTSPSLTDMLVAAATGFAGAMALVRTDISPALPGVAIAISLVPPLSVVGITLANGEPALAWGAALLFGTNMLAIILMGLVVFTSAQLEAPFSEHVAPAPRGHAALALASVVVVAGLVAGSAHSAQLLREESQVRDAAESFVADEPEWDLLGVERSAGAIEVTFIGSGDGNLAEQREEGRLDELADLDAEVVLRFERGARVIP